jgi:hypothetical protein
METHWLDWNIDKLEGELAKLRKDDGRLQDEVR